ncbi:hypothetical protein JTE90_008035 [Oedothorax gibbosus]|uniref:Cuticle protein 14 n=1 Tax=Oedothorax gibbosus TaxID=931172 RepID=A0AAV6UVX5_9ARAC|nr:hypothetical protein JTE90_008035 [Oedothorax gibbosus]
MGTKAILIFGLIAVVQALPLIPEVGQSVQYKTEDNHGNYAFGYSEDHTSGGSFRKESGDSMGNMVGSYGLHDADGRARVVNYVADSAGFRADVHTNEPGVDPTQDSADVTVNKPVVMTSAATVVAPAIVAPTVAFHVPAVVAKPVAYHHGVTYLHSTLFHSPLVFLPHPSHVLVK